MNKIKNINKVTQSDNIVTKGNIAGGDIHNTTVNIGRMPMEGKSQLEILYEKLKKEKESSRMFCEIIDELLHFKTYAENTEVIGLEKKLENGRRLQYLNFARKSKEKFTKKLLKNEYSETAQYIYAFLLAKVYSKFEMDIYPQILKGRPEEYVNQLIKNLIVTPIENLLGDNLLHIYDDEINGMIYFLTGNCHIKWN